MKKITALALPCALVLMAFPAVSAVQKKGDVVKAAWAVSDPVFKTDNDNLNPVGEISDDGNVFLANRRALVTKKDFQKPTVKFKWSWQSESPEKYPEILAVAFRTNGALKDKWPFELDNGLIVRLNPHGNGVVSIEDSGKALGSSGNVGFKMGNTYAIEASDEGDVVVVKVDGKEVVRQKVGKDAGSAARKVTLIGREPVAGARKASTIVDLSVSESK